MKTRRVILLCALTGISLFALNLCCYINLIEAQERAQSAAADAELCQRLAHQIIALQAKPPVADTQEKAQDQLSARIEAAARQSGITGDNLASIDPEPTARVADTAYLEKPTIVQLRLVSLQQLVKLLSQLSSQGSGLRIKALRLSVPPQNQEDDLWSAEITVTYLIYAPLPQQQFNGDRS